MSVELLKQFVYRGLVDVLQNHNPELKPRDDLKEKYPSYRNFAVPPLPPLTKPAQQETTAPAKNYLFSSACQVPAAASGDCASSSCSICSSVLPRVSLPKNPITITPMNAKTATL